jgi:hypothetical protein
MSTGSTPPRPHRTTTSPQNKTDVDMDRLSREIRNDLITKQVVKSLGSPENLFKMQVRLIGGDRYRVNVFVGKDATSARIADSFFLTTDEEGKILTSSPEIVRAY